MDRIRVTVCAGTVCAVMGGSELLLLEDSLPDWMRERVDVVGAQCLEQCKSSKGHDAPYVKIGDEYISRATLPKVLERLEALFAAA